MKKILIIVLLSILISFEILNAQSGWVIQNSGTSFDLSSVIMIDSNYYITAGEADTLLITSDNGVTWNKIIFPLGNITDIDFVTEEIGLMTTEFDLLKTTNKGINWSVLQRNQFSSSQRSLDFINETTGYICGTDDSPVAYVIKTTDSGINWIRYWMNDIGTASDLKFFDVNNGVSIVCNRLHFTINGGVNWSQRMAPFSCVNSIYSFNFNSHFAFGYLGKIYKTINAGVNWVEQNSGTTKHIFNSFFLDSALGYAVGDSGLILRTSNGGIDWAIQNSNTIKKLYNVYFYDNDIGIIVGEGGTILKTTTGGLTFVNSNTNVIPYKFSLSQNYPNPFNPETVIRYSLSENRFVTLKVFDVRGNEIATLVNEKQNSGTYNYQFSTVNYQLSSGVYFYKLEAGEFTETKRMILLK